MKAADPAGDPFLVEGAWAVDAVLVHADYEVELLTVESGRHPALVEKARGLRIPVEERARDEIREIRGFDFHRGVFAEVVRPLIREPDEQDWESIRSIVIPFGLADPGNLGTVIRAAVGFGSDAIAVPEGLGADLFNRKCIRASATALFRVPLFAFCEPGVFLEKLQEKGFVRFATSLGEGTTPLREVEPSSRMAIFFGSEAAGLPESVESCCDEKVHIPMASNLDSLNVGASAGVVLYELLQRKEVSS